jgi:ERCC4-type nuclease
MLRTKAAAPAVRVVVDMREFMSSLPAVLYQQVRSIQNKPIER